MTADKELELRLLALLRHREYAGKYIELVQPVAGYLSKEGQIILRALAFAQRNGESPLVSLVNLKAIIKEQFPLTKGDLEPIDDTLRALKQYKEKDSKLAAALVDQYIRRVQLMEVSTRAARAVEANQLDEDFMQELVKIAQPKTRTEEEAFWRFDPTGLFGHKLHLNVEPTPWDTINEEIEGGYRAGELIEVCALSKVGKTHWLVNECVHSLKRGKSVGYISITDLDRVTLGMLFARCLLMKSKKSLLASPGKLKKLKRLMDKRGTILEIADFTHRPCRIQEVEATIERWKTYHEDRLAKVCIDRLEEAVPAEKVGIPRLEIAGMWRYTRMVARRYGVPILVDSQARAEKEGKAKIRITDGAECRIGKAAILDLFFGLGQKNMDPGLLYVNIEGRRPLSGNLLRMRIDKQTGVIREDML